MSFDHEVDPKFETASVAAPRVAYGGFWIRLVAAAIDGIILYAISRPFAWIFELAWLGHVDFWGMQGMGAGMDMAAMSNVLVGSLGVGLITTTIGFLYHAGFYASKGATPGKMVIGVQVIDERTGKFPGVGQTFLREVVGKFVSAVLLMAGYWMVAFREDKAALHDLMASTRVVKKRV